MTVTKAVACATAGWWLKYCASKLLSTILWPAGLAHLWPVFGACCGCCVTGPCCRHRRHYGHRCVPRTGRGEKRRSSKPVPPQHQQEEQEEQAEEEQEQEQEQQEDTN